MGVLRDKWIIRWNLVNSISTLAAEEVNLTDRVRASRQRAKAAFLHVLLCELLLQNIILRWVTFVYAVE